jgi:hypothetical protein
MFSSYNFLIPGIKKIIEDNGCIYQYNSHNDLCCFGKNDIEMDRDVILEMMKSDNYRGINDEVLSAVKKAKDNKKINWA